MDNLDESENTAKVSDSAYSNSCCNSQSRRSHSSKSTHSGSNSSGSSGYGGKQSTSDSGKTLLPEKRTKDKEGKKKKQPQTGLVPIEADVEFRLPNPAPITEAQEKLQNVSPPPASDQTQKMHMSLDVYKEDTVETPDNCLTAQPSLALTVKPVCSEGFSCVISVRDGVVMYMSSSLTEALGFPKEMWIGRYFIDFIHPLDHNTFASQITSGLEINGTLDTDISPSKPVSTIFCRIRRYKSLKTGFNVKERPLSFSPFMLKLSFKKVYEEKGSIIYLVIQATPVMSAFKSPNEVIEDAVPFMMRHLPNGTVEYIDKEAIPLLGYLPQHIISKDILKLYHPEDLPYVRHLYETIVKQGGVPRSKPYRLMTQNGDYLKLDTEWSSFINPWSRKLEFVVGKHYVVEGPGNPDVFQSPPASKTTKNPEEDDNEIENIRNSIVRILNEAPMRSAEMMKQQMTKRCQDLASVMESLSEEQPKVEEELRLEVQENDSSYYERDSVMLGGISPHHDYSDSKSSSSSPLSYNQLNYNINLKRYFDSHQEVLDENGAKVTETTLEPVKGHFYTGQCMSHYSSDSVEISSVDSATRPGAIVEESTVARPHDYHTVRLTETILTKHNSEMEKIFVKKYRDSRPTKKEEREKISNLSKQKRRDHLVRCNASFVPTAVNADKAAPQAHGLKRASKQAEAEPLTHKQHCASSRQMRRQQPCGPCTPRPSVSTAPPLWPQSFGNVMTPFVPHQLIRPITAVPGFVPMYYLPTPGPAMCTSQMSAHNSIMNSTPMQFQTPAVQYMMYGQAVFGSPIVVSPISHQATFPRQPVITPNQLTTAQNNLTLATSNYEEACKPGVQFKPSVKTQFAAWREEKRAAAATPPTPREAAARTAGNIICSATNALNRSNEKVPESSTSQDSKMKSEETVDRTDGESSFSSFYSSFFKTDSGSADDSGDTKNMPNFKNPEAPTIPGMDNLLNKQLQRRKKDPPWMQEVSVTSDLIYKYQVLTKSLDEVLISDKNKLVGVEQPSLVNDQLGQLYMDMRLEGATARLTLEEGITSSGSSSDDGHKLAMDALAKRARRKRKYSKLVMIYEEDAPLPSAEEEETEPEPSTSVT